MLSARRPTSASARPSPCKAPSGPASRRTRSRSRSRKRPWLARMSTAWHETKRWQAHMWASTSAASMVRRADSSASELMPWLCISADMTCDETGWASAASSDMRPIIWMAMRVLSMAEVTTVAWKLPPE
ncbi:hypothetical protein CDD83_6087 [Cordyceps sp. RAO-2017]|nr:hypothetical protein CDD83_6087 [Cordyceps sp. RAO-2017]